MAWYRDLSIKRKLNAVMMLTSAAALLAASAALVVYEVLTFRKGMVQELSTLASITGINCSAALDFDRPDEAERILIPLSAKREIVLACIYRHGTNWARYPTNAPLAAFPSPEALAAVWPALQARAGRRDEAIGAGAEVGEARFGPQRLELFQPIYDKDSSSPGSVVYFRSTLDKHYARLRQYVGIMGVVLVFALAVALLTSGRLQGMISSPILGLSRTARAVRENRDYSVRAESGGRDEVGALIVSFNEMLEQIQQRDTQLREARDTADRANKAKSNFLSFMSHELRTPLTSIIGFSEVLMLEVAAEKRQAWVDDLRRIHESGKYLLELINDILDLSKIEAGKMDVHVESFEVCSLVRDVTEVMRGLVEKKSNRLEVECPGDLGLMQADRIKVRQCFLNLLSNAGKFTENGVVTLTAGRITREGVDWLIFRVKDTGIGMDSEQMGKLFRAFSQGDSSTSRRYGGTGLGLALTKQFCRMMGGTIGVESEPGRGSVFTIELPARVSMPAAPATIGELTTPLSPTGDCVLVIDDDPSVHLLLENALRPEGYRLAFASSGPEGLRLAKELRPAVITLDVIMPEMDGWVVLSLLKADPELAGIPVVMLTVCAEQDFAFAMGVADYLKKPIDRERLKALLAKYGQRARAPQVLVVEDDLDMREMLSRMLERERWTVLQAENGLAALESIRRSPPALIILDLLMPVMDGWQLVAELQKRADWRQIPIVVVSAKDLTPADRERLQNQVKTILQKGSFGRAQLVQEVQKAVRQFLSEPPAAPSGTGWNRPNQ